VKPNKTEFISFRTTKEVKNMLEKLMVKHERPLSDVIHQLLKSFIKNPPKKLPINDKE